MRHLLTIACIILSSCISAYRQGPDGSREYLGMVGTDAHRVRTPSGWQFDGVNQSNAATRIVGGVVTKAVVQQAAPLLQPAANGVGAAISTLAK